MDAHNFPEANRTMNAPRGQEDRVGGLRVFAGHLLFETDGEVEDQGLALVSRWRPTLAELAILCNGGSVELTILGNVHPVVSLGVHGEPPVIMDRPRSPEAKNTRDGRVPSRRGGSYEQ